MIDVAKMVAWLNACIDQDERSARFAIFDGSTGEWSEPNSGTLDLGIPDSGLEGLVLIGDQRISRFAEHFNPARQLREVKVKRRTLAEHSPVEHLGWVAGPSGTMDDKILGVIDYDCAVCGGQRTHPWPCQTVRLVASLYDGQPGYRPEWAPEATGS